MCNRRSFFTFRGFAEPHAVRICNGPTFSYLWCRNDTFRRSGGFAEPHAVRFCNDPTFSYLCHRTNRHRKHMEETNHAIARWLTEAGWSETYVNLAVKAVIILGILVVAYAAAVLFRRLIVPLLQKISARTKAVWDDHLFSDKVMHRAARLTPASCSVRPAAGWLSTTRPVCCTPPPKRLPDPPDRRRPATRRGVPRHARARPPAAIETPAQPSVARRLRRRSRPLAVRVGAILIVRIAHRAGRHGRTRGDWALRRPSSCSIFRDSILGLVAGVQLSANDMLRPGRLDHDEPNTAPTGM